MNATVLVGGVLVELQGNVADLPFDSPVGWVVFAMIGVAVVVGPWILLIGTQHLRQSYEIFSNDPIGAGTVQGEDGVVEVEGTARVLDDTITGKYSNETALAYSYHRKRRKETTDSDGNKKTEWRTVDRGKKSVPFLVVDETGEVAVDPSEASLSINRSKVQRDGGIRFGKRNRKYREYEGRIEPGDSVHVYGQARSPAEADGPPVEDETYIGQGPDVSKFIVSKGSELRTVLRNTGTGLLLVLVGVLWIPSATALFLFMVEELSGLPLGSWLIGLLG